MKWYTNLPDGINTEKLISVYVKENINNKDSLSSSDFRYFIENQSYEEVDEIFVEGYIYIDMANNLWGPIQFSISHNLKLQSLLYFDCAFFLILIVAGLILFINNFKVGQEYISNKLESLPIDIKFILFIFSIVLILSFIPIYIKTLRLFSLLRRRIISFSLLTILTIWGVLIFWIYST